MSKFLPIGSVCKVKTTDKDIMIIGYYSTRFNGNLKIRDYIGCVYPEGLLNLSQICGFNHNDIEKVLFKGYENEKYKKFNVLLGKALGVDIQSAGEFHKENDMFLTKSDGYSKLLFDENGVVMISETAKKEEKPTGTNYEFDENGNVTSIDNKSNLENPFIKTTESHEEKKTNFSDIVSKDKADTKDTIDEKNSLNEIKFDENGIVISAPVSEPKEFFTFDENGVVIDQTTDKEKKVSETNEKYTFDENGVVISNNSNSIPKYEFDENGIVIEQK